jgi:hypothetical protein
MGIGDWGLGIGDGDWGLGQSPIPQSPIKFKNKILLIIKINIPIYIIIKYEILLFK